MSDTKTNEPEAIETLTDNTTTAYGYEINTFKDGNILTAEHLNDMQDSIHTVFGKIKTIIGDTDSNEGGTLLDRVNQLAASNEVSKLSGTVKDLSSDVGTLKEIVGTVEGEADGTLVSKVETLETQLNGSSGIGSRVGTLETQLNGSNGIESRVDTLETKLEVSDGGTGNTIADRIKKSEGDITTLSNKVDALESPGGFIKNSTDTNGWNAPIVYGDNALGSTQKLQPGQIYLEY
jgi:hypothetical protein